MDQDRRVVVIGLDGMPASLVERLGAAGVMPRLEAWRRRGAWRHLTSSVPEISSVAWSTLMTGVGPGEHGIYGFMELRPGSYRLTFPNFRDLRVEPFWTALNRRGVRTAIINMPSTYPAAPLAGLLVSGFVAVEPEQAVYPPDLHARLRAMDYRIDVDAELAHTDLRRFLADVLLTLERRAAFMRWAWEQEAWGVFVFVVTETDRLQHFLFAAVADAAHPLHAACLDFYRRVDALVGELLDRLTARDRALVVSDHGFCELRRELYVNAWLRERGWLRLARVPAESYEDIGDGTRAFALDPCRLYLHRRGRYPRGGVGPEEEAGLLDALVHELEAWRCEGQPVIRRVYRRDELYRGPAADRAPDLVAVAHDGYDLKATLRATAVEGRGPFTGMHTRENALLLAVGDHPPIGEQPDIRDVRALIEAPWR